MISSKLLRAFLDEAYDARVGKTLRESLRSNESAALAVIGGGSPSSIQSGPRHTIFASMGQGITPAEIVEVWRRLIDVHDQSVTDLAIVLDDTQNNDPAIKTKMMTYLREHTGHTSSFQFLIK